MNYLVSVPIKYLTVILVLLTDTVVYGEQKSYSCYNFPPLYNFDNYDACLSSTYDNLPPTYCMVYAEIKPNNSSVLWQQIISHYEEFPFRYRRDRLFFGVCLERCRKWANKTFKPLSNEDDVLNNEIIDYFGKVHKRPLDLQFRKEYHTILHNCVNHEFYQKYDLNLRTYIEYCVRPDDENHEIEKQDSLEKLFYKLLGILLVLNVLSTLYDFLLKLQQPEDKQNNDFYKTNQPTTGSKLLTSFSLCRNYYRIMQPNNEVCTDLRFLDCFRSMAMTFAVFGHIYFLEFQNISNPEYFEYSERDKNKLWIVCTTPVIQIFFVMSGLFLFIKLQQMQLIGPQTSWRKFFLTFIKLSAFRYIRFLPSVAFLMIFNATILTRLQDGPFWRHITEPLRTFSRDRGWLNLLMVNNFSQKESASHHTWYLAADWQLFVLYLLVLMIIAKYPKFKKVFYISLAILSFFIPFVLTYWYKLQPNFVIKPESYRYTYFKDMDVYYKVYTPFYTNLSGYLVGIICGEIYLKYMRTEEVRKFIRQPKIYLWVYCILPISFIMFWSTAMLELSKPSFWTATYAGLHIIVWNIIICSVPLLFMSCNCGWLAYEICCLPIFRVLGRIAFQVYIWHLNLIYLIQGYHRQPYYVNTLYFFTQFVVVYTIANIAAYLFALFVEYPIAQCTQLFASKGTSKHSKKSS